MNNFWKKIKKPFFMLAPMAGYTDSSFRLLCRKMGADVVVSELISADAIAHSQPKIKISKEEIVIDDEKLLFNKVLCNRNKPTAELLSFFEEERPFVVQLFGKNPDSFAKAASWITKNLKPDGIDINMGCPAKKVVGSDHGAALLKNPKLAVEIVQAVKKNTDLPVSVKTRLGWECDDEILEFAPFLVNAGIDTIIIHGRTYKDGFRGDTRWKNIFKVKEMFGDKITVIGNGDVSSISEKDEGGNIALDGVAIGRAAFGKPQIFQSSKLKGKNENLNKIILRHAMLACKTKGVKGIIEFRKHLLAYLKGFPNAKQMRLLAVKIESVEDIEVVLGQLDG